ncbi:MAG: FkbM family methyltransferase [Verrucomicrobiota bacterium]
MIKDLIYDVGMNNGDDTAYYLHRGYRVIAIEANPEVAEAATKRFAAEVAAGRLTVLNIAIAEEPGEQPFWICESQSEWSSFHREIASRDGSAHHQINVQCKTFASVLSEHGVPYFLKVDIEGNDALCLGGLDPADLPAYVSVEAVELDWLKKLHELGYGGFKCISQHNFLPIQLEGSAHQRRYEMFLNLSRSDNPMIAALRKIGGGRLINRAVQFTRHERGWWFPWGASGTFAEKTRGRWQSYDELCETYLKYQSEAQQGGSSIFWHEASYSFWADFHARKE